MHSSMSHLQRPPAVIAALVFLSLMACGSSQSASSASSPSPTPSLTPLTVMGEPGLPIKSAGFVLAVLDSSHVKIRVDPGNQGQQAAIDNTVILLRSSPGVTVFVWAGVGQQIPGSSATSMSDLKVGEHVTFAFDQRTRDPSDGSYITGVIGRSRPTS
jgi:hypothetical protein